jgi:UDP-xylose:glucoside alpha-1,3-xylosyltransferase
MITTFSRQSRRRFGVLTISFLFSIIVFLTLVQDESIDDLVEKVENESFVDESFDESLSVSIPRVHLVVVACEGKSKSAIDEAKNMIKSAILLSTEKKIKVTIFTNEGNKDHVMSQFMSWPIHVQEKMDLKVKVVSYPLPPEEISEFRDWWGPCASFRLFLPEVLHDTDAVLYVDSDVLFIDSPQSLWDHFSKFNKNQVGGLASRVGWDFKVPASNQNFIMKPTGGVTQVNSGVFLMNLTRMRQEVFVTAETISLEDNFKWDAKLLIPLYYRFKKDMYGDQNLINTVFHYNPDKIYFLPCRWNYHHKFCFDSARNPFINTLVNPLVRHSA